MSRAASPRRTRRGRTSRGRPSLLGRAAPLGLAALAGLLAGAVSMLALQAPAAGPPTEPSTSDDGGVGGDHLGGNGPATLRTTDDGLLLVWSSGGIPDGLAEQVASIPQVDRTTTVSGDLVDLVGSFDPDGAIVDDVEDGWAIPLDALAIEPSEYAGFLPKGDQAAIGKLAAGEALLGASSAELRGLSVGDTVVVGDGEQITVRDVVDDALVGAAELVVSRADAVRAGIDTDRFLLVRHRGDRAGLEAAIRRATDVEVRIRAPGETPYLRHGDAVLPQAHVKAEFGEFAYRRTGEDTVIEQDPGWVRDHVVDVEVPILGTVRCHRSIVAQLEGALAELVDRDLAHLVDADQYAGCHEARLIDEDAAVSRHAWGIAVDLNADDNPTGDASMQDARLIDTFARWGFASGEFWLVPDAMHFEYVGGPEPTTPKVDATGDAG